MRRPDNSPHCHDDRLRQREGAELPPSEGHQVSACDGNRPTIATPQPVDRVVLVPCSASSTRQWDALTAQLAGFHPVPLDLWGHDNQERWHGAGPLSLAEEAAAIHQACPDGPPFHLVGHSYGGGVALRFALDHPERLRSLTLVEPSSFHFLRAAGGSDAHLLDEIRAVADAVNHGVICGDYTSGMQIFIDYWGGPGSWESLPDDKKAQFAQLAVYVAHHFWSLIEEKTPLAAYAAIDVPTLIVCGTSSPAPSRAITRLLAETLPGARHRTIRNAGHMSPITHPADVNALVVEHLLMNSAATCAHPPVVVAAGLPTGDRLQGPAKPGQDCSPGTQVRRTGACFDAPRSALECNKEKVDARRTEQKSGPHGALGGRIHRGRPLPSSTRPRPPRANRAGGEDWVV